MLRFIARLGFGLLAVLPLLACNLLFPAAAPAPDDPWALRTVHKSTFARVQDYRPSVTTVFASGQFALVAEDMGENDRLFLVDLVNGTEQVLELDYPKQLGGVSLYPAGDSATAEFYLRSDVYTRVVYRVETDGSLHPLKYLQHVSPYIGGDPGPSSADLEPLLADGSLDGLTAIQYEACAMAEDGTNWALEPKVPSSFYNDTYYLLVNIPEMQQRLYNHSQQTVTNPCTLFTDPKDGSYEVRLVRQELQDVHNGPSQERILQADVYRDGELVHTYDLQIRGEFYYAATLNSGRLCFVGTYVKCVEMM